MKNVSIHNPIVKQAIWILSVLCFSAQTPRLYALSTDPVPRDQIPGQNAPGTIIVDDSDEAVTVINAREAGGDGSKNNRRIASSIVKPREGEFTPYNNTVLNYNGYNEIGDGLVTVSIAPTLPKGSYQTWIRFGYQSHNYHGNAKKAVITLHTNDGEVPITFLAAQANANWLLLGTHEFDGKGPAITLRNNDMKGNIWFDAAVFIPTRKGAQTRPDRYLPPQGSPFQNVIRNVADAQMGPTDIASENKYVQQRLRMNDFRGRFAWDTMKREKDRRNNWADKGMKSSHLLTGSAEQIKFMALAWAGANEIDELGLRGNPQLLKDIIEAMEVFLTNRWTPETKWDVNWWDFEIGVPRHIFNAMALISPHTPEHVKEMAFASMDRFQLIPTKFYNNAFNASGANLVWNISNHIASDALRESAEGLERCKDALPQVMRWVDEDPALLEGALDGTRKGKGPTVDGFWKDGSYIQHGHLPYIGAYGCLLISDLIQSVAVLNDTPWEVTDPSVNNIGKWVDKHFLTVGYEGELFPRTIGRAAGSKGIENANEWLIIALAEISTILPREKAVEVGAYLKRWYTRDGVDPDFTRASFTQFMKLYTIFENDAIAPAGPFIASNTFGAIDMATHHRPDWAATVAMSSTRIHSHESIWGANLKGWNMGEGVLYVYPSDPMRYRGGWMALVDPTRLPGITTNTWEFEPAGFGGANPKICKPSNQAFVGGASINNLASVSAMTVGRDYSSLQARKGWFFFPDSIVCLGSGITASDGRATETIIENCKRTAETQTLTANGEKVELSENKALLPPVSTLHLTGEEPGQSIGWWFPSPAKNITVTGGTRSGAWKDIAKGSSEDIMSHPWLTLVAEHGMDPQNASYQYVILPSVSESELQTFAKSGNISIHSNTEKIQAVRDNKNQITAIIFYEPGEIAGVKADQPCIVILQNTPSSYDLAVVDPTHKLKEMKIELALNTHLQPESNERVSAVFDKTKFLITINSANTFGDETVLTWKK